MSKKRWIILALLALLFAGMFSYGLVVGDAGYVFKIACQKICFS